ncbi:threonylcarbamoyl-AMP synthase [Bacteroidia bacterium]|nr:threonylcarbamoyl-AMP synthase [Bacteroidia bacterium]
MMDMAISGQYADACLNDGRTDMDMDMAITEKLKEEIFNCCKILKEGGVILYPTDTIWGLGCDATNSKAVERIYKLKQRDDTKSMLLLLDDVGKIASYADVPDIALELIEMSDKPLTIIYPNAKGLSPLITGADKTVGIRITREEFSKSLLFRLNRPLVSTSANVSGQPPPTCFADISDDIKKAVDYIVDFRKNETQNPPPSSIIKLEMNGTIQIIRP